MFKGCCTALVTPFDENGDVNYEMFERIIEQQIKAGVSALLFLGTTGESPALSEKEQEEIVRFAVKIVRKRLPVLVGGGSNSTQKTIDKCLRFKVLGADGFLIVSPYYNKATQEGLYLHYKAIADAVQSPIIIYNVPSRTGVNIQPSTITRLSEEKNIVGIKQASGNIDEVMEIIAGCKNGFSVFSGEDSLTYTMMQLGGAGVISVVSNLFPEYMAKMCNFAISGQTKKALKMQLEINPLIKELFAEVNPIPVKYGMRIVGLDSGVPRLPLTESCRKREICCAIKKLKK